MPQAQQVDSSEEPPARIDAPRMDAVVLAGGRVRGLLARTAGTTVKALTPVGGEAVICRVVAALRACPEIGRICVVGPEAVRDAVRGGSPECEWRLEAGSILSNLAAGIKHLGCEHAHQLLVCSSDLPALCPPALQDFLARSPRDSDLCMPVIRKERFLSLFPGDPRFFACLAGGRFVIGCQAILCPAIIRTGRDRIEAAVRQRKNLPALAVLLGWSYLPRFLKLRLGIGEITDRVSHLLACRSHAVLDCHPELAFDVDNVLSLWYIRRWWERNAGVQRNLMPGPRVETG